MPKGNATAADMLLQTQDLCVEFGSTPVVQAVDGVTLDIHPREILGLVGESGSGKTVFSLSVLRLIGKAGRIRRGRILWQGRDLLEFGEEEMRRVRGSEIAMIFQNPQASLNPVRTIGAQISSVIRLHQKCAPATARQESLRWLEAVRITDPIRVYEAFPHQCSGGMCQRILIAMALACRPKLLIADEPTASLDVTIQAQIMDLLLEIRETYGTAILLVSHDLGVIARMCDRIAVMYCGRIVEMAESRDLYSRPQHPYTRLLLQSVPVPDPSHRPTKIAQPHDFVGLDAISQGGCRFRPRCAEAEPECAKTEPLLGRISQEGHHVACLPRQREAADHREKRRNDDGVPEVHEDTSSVAGNENIIDPWIGLSQRV
jgi:oligopeptide/dipeptide ABC transporter ATP-binding protein